MITKQELQDQLESILSEPKGTLKGESVKECLRDIDCNGITIFWGCIPESMLDEKF